MVILHVICNSYKNVFSISCIIILNANEVSKGPQLYLRSDVSPSFAETS